MIPKKRSGRSYFPAFLEPRRRSEQAIVAVVLEAYVNGVSTRKVDRLVEQLGIDGMTKDRVSALCRALDEQVELFRQRPLEGAYPYLWLDAKQVKVRDHGRVVSKAVVVAYAVHESGVREVIGLDVGEVESGAFWVEFLRALEAARAGRRAPRDLRPARRAQRPRSPVCWAARGSAAPSTSRGTWSCTAAATSAGSSPPRCREIFNAEGYEQAKRARRSRARAARRPSRRRCASCSKSAEEDLIAFYSFPPEHWTKLRSTNPLERVNKEIGRRTDVVGNLPQRPGGDPARRRAALRAERRMAGPAPLPVGRVDGADPRRTPTRPTAPGRAGGAQSHRRLSREAATIYHSRNQRVAGRRVLRPSETLASTPATDSTPPRQRARACRRSPSPSGLGRASPFGARAHANTRVFPSPTGRRGGEQPQPGPGAATPTDEFNPLHHEIRLDWKSRSNLVHQSPRRSRGVLFGPADPDRERSQDGKYDGNGQHHGHSQS